MGSKIANATKWSSLTEVLSKLIVPFTNIFLARILTPEVFGLVATFSLVITFAEVFTDAGFQQYIVQHEFKNEDDLRLSVNVAFWTNFVFSCFVWLIILVFRNDLAVIVGSEGHGIEIAVMALNIPMVALSSIQTAMFRRDFRFKQLMPVRLITFLVPAFVTIPLALAMRNCWALIIGSLAKEIVLTVLLTNRSTWRPKCEYSVKKLKEMLSFSLLIMGDSFAIWFTTYAGTLIVGRHLDSYYTGMYKTAITTITAYISLVNLMLMPVMFSALSRAQNDKGRFNSIFYSFQKVVALLAIPLGVGIFIFRDTVTTLLLGSQWGEAALLVGLAGLGQAVVCATAQMNSNYFRALGKPQIALFVQGLYGLIMMVIILWAVNETFEMLCISRGVTYFIYAFISTCALCCVCKFPVVKVLKSLAVPITASALMALSAILLRKVNGSLLWNIAAIVVCAVVYMSVVLIIPSSRKFIKGIIRDAKS